MADSQYSTRYVWHVIVVLTLVNVFNYMDRMALSMLAPLVKADLQLSDTQLGLLIGLAFSLFYAVCGLPIARWADRGNRKNLITTALSIWSVMTALSGAAQNFWHLLLARMGVGAGEAGCIPAAQSMLCDYVPLKRRAGVFALHGFGLYVGTMLGLVLAGTLSAVIGWRWTFVALGLPGLFFALLIRLTLREPRRGRMDGVQADATAIPLRAAVAMLWQCRTYRWLALLMIFNGFMQQGLLQWLPSFYLRLFGLDSASIGWYLGLGIGAGSGAGILIGGLAANWANKRDVRWPLWMGAVTTALALPAALAVIWVPSAAASLVFVVAMGVLWSIPNGPAVAIINSVVAPRARATAQSIAIFLTSVLGFGLGPLCVGMLSDGLASSVGEQSLRYALLAPVALLPLMAFVLHAAARTVSQDLAAAGTPS